MTCSFTLAVQSKANGMTGQLRNKLHTLPTQLAAVEERSYLVNVKPERLLSSGQLISARSVVERRFRAGAWPLGRGRSYSGSSTRRDRLFLYVAGSQDPERQCFIGCGFASGVQRLASEFGEEPEVHRAWLEGSYSLPIAGLTWFKSPFSIRPLLPRLALTRDEKAWGGSLQGAFIRLHRADAAVILAEGGPTLEVEHSTR